MTHDQFTNECLFLPLGKDRYAIVDADCPPEIVGKRWYAANNGLNRWYVRRLEKLPDGRKRSIYLHRAVTNAPDGMFVDHINGDPFDNRRANLRICTRAENQRNRTKQRNNRSGYKGVYAWAGRYDSGKWIARVGINGGSVKVGVFTDPVEAAHAYDKAAKRIHGAFASLNFPENDSELDAA